MAAATRDQLAIHASEIAMEGLFGPGSSPRLVFNDTVDVNEWCMYALARILYYSYRKGRSMIGEMKKV
jgi:hypothetical protein